MLQTHLLLLEALQPLLNLPEPTQSKWVMAQEGWRAGGGPSMGFHRGSQHNAATTQRHHQEPQWPLPLLFSVTGCS